MSKKKVRRFSTGYRISLEKETAVEFFWELVSCWLLVVGACLLLDAQYPTAAGIVTILWHTAAAVVITALLTRRMGIFFVALEASAVGAILWLWLASRAEAKLKTAWKFIQWWANDMPQNSPVYTPQAMAAVHVLTHIGISLFLFTFIRLTRRMWPSLILCTGLWVYILATGDTANSAMATAAFLAGLFPLLARDQYRGYHLLSRKNKFSPLGGRWIASTSAGVLCIAIAAALLFNLPAETLHIRTRWCSVITADFQSAIDWYTTPQVQITGLDMRDVGLQAYNRLGGNLELVGKQPLAKVEGNSPSLLRLTTFDTFDGNNWSNEFHTSYRPNSHWPEEQVEALSAPAMDSPKRELVEMIASTEDVTITLLQDSNWLLTAGYTLGITEHTQTKNPLQFNSNGQLFSYFPLPSGYSYTLKSVSLPTDRFLTDRELLTLASCSSVEDPLAEDEEFFTHYTALPKGFSNRAQQLAEQETQGIRSDYERAYRISRYFSTSRGYIYTETPGSLKSDENVVDKLLKSKRGHCVYYATAMAGMARWVGIPSRLAIGYRTVAGAKDGEYLVDASNPYAWVECYIAHLGWVPFDPTPRAEQLEKPNAVPSSKKEQATNDPSVDGTKPLDQEGKEVPDELEPHKEEKSFPCWLGWLLLLLAVAGVGVRSWLIPRAYAYEWVQKRYPSTRRQTIFYYRDILRQLAGLGYTLGSAETLGELLDRLRAAEDELADDVWQSLQTVQAMLYGDVTPSQEEVARLAALWGQLDAVGRQRMPLVLFILRRRVLVPYLCVAAYAYPPNEISEENVCEETHPDGR